MSEHRLVRQDQRDGIVVGRAAGRGAGLLAEAAHDEIGADRDGRAGARAQRGGARRVVDIGRVAAPAAALIAEGRGQHLLGLMPAAGVAGAAVVFGADRLREDDRALLAQPLDQDVVARRKIDVVGGITAGRRAHVLGVERILEREDDAVHRQFVERRVPAVAGIERGGGFARVRQVTELVADRRRAGWQRAPGRVTVEFALAGDRTLAADVQGGERVELAGIGLAGDHTVLLLYRRIGGGRLHPAEFERRALIFVEVGEDRRGRDGLGREMQWHAGAHRTGYLWDSCFNGRAVLGDEQAGDAVIGAGACDVVVDDLYDGRLAGADRRVQFVDRRFFQAKRRARLALRFSHDIAPPEDRQSILRRRVADLPHRRSPYQDSVPALK
jgi:hypothetical protein